MKKTSKKPVCLTDSVIQSLTIINASLKAKGVTPIVVENPIYGCGSCSGWSSGKGVCEGKAINND